MAYHIIGVNCPTLGETCPTLPADVPQSGYPALTPQCLNFEALTIYLNIQ